MAYVILIISVKVGHKNQNRKAAALASNIHMHVNTGQRMFAKAKSNIIDKSNTQRVQIIDVTGTLGSGPCLISRTLTN